MAKSLKPENTPSNGLMKEKETQFPLLRINFILMAASAALIIIGFLLMLGGSSSGNEFNPDIFSTRRIVVGPTIAFLGFLAMAFAIIYRPKDKNKDDRSDSSDNQE